MASLTATRRRLSAEYQHAAVIGAGMTHKRTQRAAIAALLLAAIVPATAIAHDHGQDDEHRHLREAVLNGKLLPLTRILEIAQTRAQLDVRRAA